MDDIDRKITTLLSENSRRALGDIGSIVGLSISAVNERIRRLNASGAIRKFTVDADPAALGLPVLAFVWMALPQDANEDAFRANAMAHPTIAECHHVTGPWSYLVKVHVASLAEVELFLAHMKGQGFLVRSETIIVLSSVVSGPYAPPEGTT
ncbi:Lrp/AsnC family transcriptional regulator [Phyllobacterium sp. TAF24]|uniref:Lrp/AsnC family transcriptional regulator n=1 Tax=Phyllobacterium sp. TAF24 TaxID=3233068 RepID=UPI003F947EC0